MNFSLAPSTECLLRDLREWSVSELRPLAREADATHGVPPAAKAALETCPVDRNPFSGVELPERYRDGGPQDGPYVLATSVVENGAYGDVLFISLLPGHSLLGKVVNLLGTPEQVERWSGGLDRGEYGQTAFALSEPGAGSDAAGLRTSATRDGDSWILNGTKMYCSYGASADLIVVFATVDRSLGHRGIRAFIVEPTAPGFKVGKANESKLGLRSSWTSELAFEDCRIPLDHCLGYPDDTQNSFRALMGTLTTTRGQTASLAIGVAQAALDAAEAWSTESRTSFAPHRWRAIEDDLAQMGAALERGRRLALWAAWLIDQDRPHATQASMAKAYACPVAEQVCSRTMQMVGSDGYSDAHLFEKWFRDIKIMDIFEGTGNIHRRIISDALFSSVRR